MRFFALVFRWHRIFDYPCKSAENSSPARAATKTPPTSHKGWIATRLAREQIINTSIRYSTYGDLSRSPQLKFTRRVTKAPGQTIQFTARRLIDLLTARLITASEFSIWEMNKHSTVETHFLPTFIARVKMWMHSSPEYRGFRGRIDGWTKVIYIEWWGEGKLNLVVWLKGFIFHEFTYKTECNNRKVVVCIIILIWTVSNCDIFAGDPWQT